MKNYFYKYVFKYMALTLFLAISSSLFAATFNEQRKVIVPHIANAVYRDLTVLDKMELNTNSPTGQFMIELGKRPAYFWDESMKYYLYGHSTLNLNNVDYNGGLTDNVFKVNNMVMTSPDGGSFYSEKMWFDDNAIVSIFGNDSKLYINHNEDALNVNLTLNKVDNSNPAFYDVYALTYGNKKFFSLTASTYKIKKMFMRDVFFVAGYNGAASANVYFPSPRAIVYEDSGYKVKGTATDFELVTVGTNESNKLVFHYYGPWVLVNDGALTDDDNPCGDSPNSDSDLCEYSNGVKDSADDPFTCWGNAHTNEQQSGEIYNPENLCYDYQNIDFTYSDSIRKFNNNKAYYEFKVEEIYQLSASNNMEFIEQAPETRKIAVGGGGNPKVRQFMTYSSSTVPHWSLLSLPGQTQYASIDGDNKSLGKHDPVILTSDSEDNPCFYLCEGKLCNRNILYIRDYSQRILDGNGSPSYYAPGESKQQLYILTYTVGFCPVRTGTNNYYSNYEDNFGEVNDDSKVIDALLIKKDSNWVAPKVCVKRQVKCDSSGNIGKLRNYKLLSTDN